MSQLLHLILDVDEKKQVRVLYVGLDAASIKAASAEEQGDDSRIYAALNVEKLHELMISNKNLVNDSAMLLRLREKAAE